MDSATTPELVSGLPRQAQRLKPSKVPRAPMTISPPLGASGLT